MRTMMIGWGFWLVGMVGIILQSVPLFFFGVGTSLVIWAAYMVKNRKEIWADLRMIKEDYFG